MRPQPAPLILELPFIGDRLFRLLSANVVAHGQTYVVLAIYEASRRRDHPLRYDFGDEHYASAVFIAFPATDVEAEVYLIEIEMKRDGERSEELGVAKAKAY